MSTKITETNLQGLTEQEALERLAQDGYNELPATKKHSFFHMLFEVVREPMFLMLIACGLLYLLLGDQEEALMLLGFVFVIIGITFYQEQKTERALEALRDLSSPRALVIRDGKQQRIAGREVVREDIVLIAEGDRIPADAVLLSGSNISVDEVLLTGPTNHGEVKNMKRYRAMSGEDLRFGTAVTQIEPYLTQRGFEQVKNIPSEALKGRYFGGKNQFRNVMSGYAIVSAAVK